MISIRAGWGGRSSAVPSRPQRHLQGTNHAPHNLRRTNSAPAFTCNGGSNRACCSARPAAIAVRTQTLRVAWVFLTIAAASGMIWLLLVATSMSGLSLGESMTSDVLSTVVNETQFGRVSEIRLVLAVIIAGGLAYDRFPLARGLALAMSLGLTAALAWTGHAGSTAGGMGNFHLTGDDLHLLDAAIWIGGLVSLLLLFFAS